jgi:hypothetical protein
LTVNPSYKKSLQKVFVNQNQHFIKEVFDYIQHL